ncbi:alcohol dehydrogenase [Trichoderma citrinoviride]|uniref:Alcohol dehydrogenase n=1 Tax=Trichoderma citrinoviride TaxID=58853 RepID=A0A2T4B899_9HYPO|nr:alcohol dehydrogenase [Trichoderma citrinoviride]PTB65553.1 alcohol dehydrogenase [Trichoderma citrinoviride]
MSVTFTVQRGSQSGKVVQGTSSRQLGRNEAYLKITHSGLCGTDEHYLHNGIVLGHEGVGIVEAVGPDVTTVKVGDRVGFGWVHKTCGRCQYCLTGLDTYCENKTEFGIHDHDVGSFASHAVWDADALHKIPDGLDSAHAAPLMCGGATVWTPFALYGIRPTDRVGIVGVGGLGHLAIQFGAKMGCKVVVFSSSESKREDAMKLGASEFHVLHADSPLEGIEPVRHMLLCGNAQPDYSRIIPLTASAGKIYNLIVSFDAPPMPMLPLMARGISIQGSAGAPRAEIRKMLDFAVQHGIKPTIMTWPLNTQGVEDAMKVLREGKMRYRGVLVAE